MKNLKMNLKEKISIITKSIAQFIGDRILFMLNIKDPKKILWL